MDKYQTIKNLVSEGNLLIHASPNNELKILSPRTNNEDCKKNTKLLYATSSPELAIMYVINKALNIHNACQFYKYSFFKIPFLFCSIHKDYIDKVLSTEFTLYFCRKDGFKQSNDFGRLHKISFGLMTCGHDRWTTQQDTKIEQSIKISLNDIRYKKHLHNSKNTKISILIKNQTL